MSKNPITRADLPPFTAAELTAGRTFRLPLVSRRAGSVIAVRYEVEGEAFTAGGITAEIEQDLGVTSGPGMFKQSTGAAMAPNC